MSSGVCRGSVSICRHERDNGGLSPNGNPPIVGTFASDSTPAVRRAAKNPKCRSYHPKMKRRWCGWPRRSWISGPPAQSSRRSRTTRASGSVGETWCRLPTGPLLLVGRYRNAGDSRSGVARGERGLELAIFRSPSVEGPFEKILSFDKASLNVGRREVLSIEGAALHVEASGAAELFVSTEKAGIGYPEPFAEYLKPGTGVWTIERVAADSLEDLTTAPVQTIFESRDPQFVHVKDPFLYRQPDGRQMLLFCSHPYCWTSSNSGYALLDDGQVAAGSVVYDFFPRGTTWDVAIARATCMCDVPPVGRFRGRGVSLLFYDGGESIRNLDEHASAVSRPRGYSCEEIGGAAYVVDGEFGRVHRLSRHRPLFVSPWGTGCSRYVDVLATDAGMMATWQQSQDDRSQPLVRNFVPQAEVEGLLE